MDGAIGRSDVSTDSNIVVAPHVERGAKPRHRVGSAAIRRIKPRDRVNCAQWRGLSSAAEFLNNL